MYSTVVILAGSNQLLPNLFLPDKNKEMPNLTSCPLYPPETPPTSWDKLGQKNILL